MQSLNITITERELTTLLDAVDKAMENTDDHREYEALSKMFDRLTEVAYSMWDEEEA